MSIIGFFKRLFGGKGKGEAPAEEKFNLIMIRKRIAPVLNKEAKVYVKTSNKKKVEVWVSEEFRELPDELCKKLNSNGGAKWWYLKTNYTTEGIKIGNGYFTVKGDNFPNPQGPNPTIELNIERAVSMPDFIELLREYIIQEEGDSTNNSVSQQNEDSGISGSGSEGVAESSDKDKKTESLMPNTEADSTNIAESSEVINFDKGDNITDISKNTDGRATSKEDKEEYSVNESSIAQLAKELGDIKREREEFRKHLIAELKKMNRDKEYKDLPLSALIDKLRAEIASLNSKYSNAQGAVNEAQNLRSQVRVLQNEKATKESLQRQYNLLKEDCENKSKKIQTLENEATQRKVELNKKDGNIGLLESSIRDLNSQVKTLTADVNVRDEELSVLRASEVGSLKALLDEKETAIESLNATLAATQKDLTRANNDIEVKTAQIAQNNDQIRALNIEKSKLNACLNDCKNEITKLDSELKKASGIISQKNNEISGLMNEKENLNNTIIDKNNTIKTKEGQLVQLSKDRSNLESMVAERDKTISQLNKNVTDLSSDKSDLQNVISGDVAALETVYFTAIDALTTALASEFLKECDVNADTGTVESMCKKIRKGVDTFSKAVYELKDEKFESTVALEKAYEKIVAENIESYAFTEIARWWAYSRLPFVIDKSREEGRSVEISSIDDAYAALSRIMMLAGYRYQMPVLFVQNLTDGDYKNVTGTEQMNLDYQFPNVREHMEHIDRDDRENVVLDIAQLGYYKDNQLLKKTSVIV